MKKAINENKDAKWRIAVFHQDIYGSGYDHSDSDGMVLRTQLTPLMDKYKIDVVMQGHDHTYSRTFQLEGDGKDHTSYSTYGYKSVEEAEKDSDYQAQNNCYEIVNKTVGGTVTNPEGTVYLEANSATGSKFYNLIASKQDFISERSQTWTPTYSVVKVTDKKFSVTTYDATTRKTLQGSTTYTIVKDAVKQTIQAKNSYKKNRRRQAFSLNAKAKNTAYLYLFRQKRLQLLIRTEKVTVKKGRKGYNYGEGSSNQPVSGSRQNNYDYCYKESSKESS